MATWQGSVLSMLPVPVPQGIVGGDGRARYAGQWWALSQDRLAETKALLLQTVQR